MKEWCSFLPHEHERCCYYLRLKYWKNSYPFPTFVLQLSLFSFPCLGQSPGPAPGRQASLMKRPGAPLPFSSTEGAEADRIRHVAAGLYPQPLVWKPQTSWPAERPHPFPPPLRPLDLPPVWPQKALFCPHLALGCHCSNRGVGAGWVAAEGGGGGRRVGSRFLPQPCYPTLSRLSYYSPPGSSSWSLCLCP